MTDDTPVSAPKGRRAKDDVVDAEIVEEPTTSVEPVVVADAEPEPSAPAQQVVYIHAPAAPRKKGNRGIGALFAVLSSIIFTALLAIATAVIGQVNNGSFSFSFVTDARFYIPVLFFIIGFVLLVLVLNRAAWWAYIVGSLALAVFVYFGTVGVGLLGQGIISHTPAEAAVMYGEALRSPFVIVSALLAREVSIWVGAGIASRGRRVKLRNVEAHAAYEQELADKKAEHASGVANAV
ncbi:MAG: hypothetical protein ABJA94_06175 [Rhodoglobus sp.]